jgi:cyclase
MLEKRVIPVLLIENTKLVKTVRFKDAKYVGDPINTVKLFNDKEVDELLVLDIGCSKKNTKPDLGLLREMASEAFMPMGYGGGVKDLDTIEAILKLGFEKVSLNTVTHTDKAIVREASRVFGSQSVVCSMDVGESFLLRKPVCYSHTKKKNHSVTPVEWARELEAMGAGEILVNSVARDGVGEGYDCDLINAIASEVSVPVIALGGAWNRDHLVNVLRSGADAAAAGSMFIYHGPLRAVLVNYPKRQELEDVFLQAKL